jgi:hypothetical protein
MSLTKIFLAASVAMTTLGAGAAQAQYYAPPPPPGYYHHHHWHEGDRYYGHGHPIYHWERYHLPPPPPGHYWVEDDGRFFLIGGGYIGRIFIP